MKKALFSFVLALACAIVAPAFAGPSWFPGDGIGVGSVGSSSTDTTIRLTPTTRVHLNIPLSSSYASDFITPLAAGTPGPGPVFVKDLSSTAIAIGLTTATQVVVVNYQIPDNYLSNGQFEIQYRYAADATITITASAYTTNNYAGSNTDGSIVSGAQQLTLTATGLPVTLRWQAIPDGNVTFRPGKACTAVTIGALSTVGRGTILEIHGWRFTYKPYGVAQ